MTEPFHDYHDRCAVPGPTFSGSDRINTATIGTAIALQIHQRLISVIPYADIPMPPYPVAPATFLQAMCRARKHIVSATLQYLLDTDHQEKRQYPVPSRRGGGYRPVKNAPPPSGSFLPYLIRSSLIALRRFNLICRLSRSVYCD